MLETIRNGVLKKGVVTSKYPAEGYVPHDGFLGMPVVDGNKCASHKICEEVCPTNAIRVHPSRLEIDLGRCVFCGECAVSCPEGAMTMSKEFELAARERKELVRTYAINR